jgi:hypothetical protein
MADKIAGSITVTAPQPSGGFNVSATGGIGNMFPSMDGLGSNQMPGFLEGEDLFPGMLDRPSDYYKLPPLKPTGAYTEQELELWDTYAPQLSAFDPNSPEFQAALDALINAGVENISTTNLENTLLDKDFSSLGGDESIVTDDEQWDAVDKTKDLASIFQDALDIFGAYDRNSIRKVVDVVNERGVSAQDVATMTGNTVESINQAAAESDTAINNQGTAGDVVEDTGAGDTGDVFNEATDTPNTGEVLTPSAPEGQDTTESTVVEGGDEVTNNETPVLNDETPVLPTETPVIPVLDTPVIAEDPNVIVNDTPILPTIMPPTPKQTTNISLFQSIQDTPITDSLFFEPKFTELDNIPVGMFERFLQATGGR